MEGISTNGNTQVVQVKKVNLLGQLEISVSESEKRANGTLNIRDYFTVYSVEVKVNNPELLNSRKLVKVTSVWRRYTEFEQLRKYLVVTYPFIVVPPLPEKRVMFGWQKTSTDTFDPIFVDRRRAGLENFLLRVAAHPILGWDIQFLEFLQNEEGWRESHKSNGYLQAVESTFKNLSISVRSKKRSGEFEELKHYSNTLYTNLNNLLKARARIAEKLYTIHKLHANYGRVFSEWSVVEKDMGDALQKTGHYLDSLASSVDGTLEDEEILIDQMKEYLFFADSLQQVCRHRDMLQLQLESAEENVNNKNLEREKALQGKISLISKLFGSVDTEELREAKVSFLDQQIEEGSNAVVKNKESLREFTDKAMEDINRFQEQKILDLKDILTSYAFLQLKASKKNLQTWTQVRDCLQNIT
ncbi:sorting nexin-4-like isoform X1 [Coccinella septempunctata]|uniref:sorting nexin-4-like isoform X1 n=1 Tax=Coccinella septempunctata TaxID=41139 RepID=UPI001D07441C|nr:sorting nexin-4-like isoform X1 [Coccinella septempunctata]